MLVLITRFGEPPVPADQVGPPTVEERIGDFDRLVEQTSRIVTQINDITSGNHNFCLKVR